jgi:hypothetical protein
MLLALALMLAVTGAARAEGNLLTMTSTGPSLAQEQAAGTRILGYDSLTVLTVAIGGMFGAALGTEVAVIGLGVAGYSGPVILAVGTTGFVGGAAAGAFSGNWLLEAYRSQRAQPLERASPNAAAQAATRR